MYIGGILDNSSAKTINLIAHFVSVSIHRGSRFPPTLPNNSRNIFHKVRPHFCIYLLYYDSPNWFSEKQKKNLNGTFTTFPPGIFLQ
jgi:hypothetical protein